MQLFKGFMVIYDWGDWGVSGLGGSKSLLLRLLCTGLARVSLRVLRALFQFIHGSTMAGLLDFRFQGSSFRVKV